MPCETCRTEMESSRSECCSQCGVDLAGSDNPCPSCRNRASAGGIDDLKAIGPWCGVLREWLSILKYDGELRMASYLSLRLVSILEDCWPGVPLVPVPPRPWRLFHEGFDPVAGIVKYMSRLGIESRRLLKRRGNETQKSLNREARLASGSLDYRLRNPELRIHGEWVIFDDVTTTGATINLCAALLKSAGAEGVHGLVVCRD